jgi:hypothetical protein
MTEGILIGGLVILGGLVASYMKKHPFYSHKTQKYKENYQRKLQDILSHTYDSTDAYWLSRAIADNIFDFGTRTYHDYHVERYEKRAKSERPHLFEMHVEEPRILCEHLTERAVELKVPISAFSMHMRYLWQEYLVPVGRLTPASVDRLPGSSLYVTELKNLPVSQEDMQIFMHKTGQA